MSGAVVPDQTLNTKQSAPITTFWSVGWMSSIFDVPFSDFKKWRKSQKQICVEDCFSYLTPPYIHPVTPCRGLT